MPIPLTAALSLAALLAFALPGAAQEEHRSQRINEAVDRGVAWLKGRQKPDGSFSGYHEGPYPTGVTALALLSLLKSDVPPSDPVVAKGVNYLAYQEFKKTYSTGLTLMVIDAIGSKEHDAWAQRGADWLVSVRNKNLKIWGYPEGGPDLSNTQYAVLGLQAAVRRNAKVQPIVWLDVLDWMERQQADSGAITYTPGHRPSGSMALAGIATGLICMDEAQSDRRFQTKSKTYETVVRRAFDWFVPRYSVERNPDGEGDASALANLHYYLYGLERVGVLANAKTIGGHDWYRDGSNHLIGTQAGDGAWTAPGSVDPMSDTCFALLFLRRATVTLRSASPVATDAGSPGTGETEVRKAAPAAAVDARPSPKPHLLFIRDWLVLGPFPDPEDDELKKETINEKSAEPAAGQRLKGGVWNLFKSEGDFVSLEAAIGAAGRSVGYAFTWLHALEDAEVALFLGSDDGVRVLLDGETVFYGHIHGGAKADQHVIPLQLSAGAHRLLLKIDNVEGAWGLFARIGAKDGGPPSGIVWSTRKKIDDAELRESRVVPLEERGYEKISVAPNAPKSWEKNSGVTKDREPARAFDGDPRTFWSSDGPTLVTPKDVGVEFPDDVEIGAAEIWWWATNHSPALDGYKLEYWSGGRWNPIADQLQRVEGAHWVHTFAPVKTRRFRILATKMPADADRTYRRPAIYEMTLFRKAGLR